MTLNWTCRRCGKICGRAREWAYHENSCVGLAGNYQAPGQPAPANQAADGGNAADEDARSDSSEESLLPELQDHEPDSSDEEGQNPTSREEAAERRREHFEEQIRRANAVFEMYGDDKASFDVAEFITRKALGQRGGNELLALLAAHDINGGEGLSSTCDSVWKINNILDSDASLPFAKHQVSSELDPDIKYSVYTRCTSPPLPSRL